MPDGSKVKTMQAKILTKNEANLGLAERVIKDFFKLRSTGIK